ncbi:type IV secretion system protein [Brevundimonas vesicularis]|nr:type IV secretion system protein [Brevundimonas vesicularis]
MSAEIFGPAYTYIDGKLAMLLGERVGSVMSSVQPVLMTAVTLYVVLYGYAILRGSIDEPIMDFIMRAVKLVFIVAIATTGAYNSFVTGPLFTGMPNWIAGAVTGGSTGGAGAPFDQMLAMGLSTGEAISETATPLDLATNLIAVVVIIVGVLAAAIGFAIFMIAKVALALLVTLGPIFIACLVFEPTRRFFYGWLSQAVNYLVLFALMIVVFQMIVDFTFAQYGAGGQDPIIQGFMFIALSFLGVIFFLQVPALAAGIAGGAAAGLKDFQNIASKAPKIGGGGGGGGGSGSGGGSVSKR